MLTKPGDDNLTRLSKDSTPRETRLRKTRESASEVRLRKVLVSAAETEELPEKMKNIDAVGRPKGMDGSCLRSLWDGMCGDRGGRQDTKFRRK